MKRSGPVSSNPNEIVVRAGRETLIFGLVVFVLTCGYGVIGVICGIKNQNVELIVPASILIPLGIFSSILVFLYYYFGYTLITVKGILQCNAVNKTRFLRWESLNYLGILVDYHPILVFSQHIPKMNNEGFITARYPWPKAQTIQVDWDDKNEKQEERFRRILAASNAPLQVKKEYLGEDYEDRF